MDQLFQSQPARLKPRRLLALANTELSGWALKVYVILTDEAKLDYQAIDVAVQKAVARLPVAGAIDGENSNHGTGFIIIHFAERGIILNAMYWMWGTVLGKMPQFVCSYDDPYRFELGEIEIVGCLWELEVMNHEAQQWQHVCEKNQSLAQYLTNHFKSSTILN